MTDSNRPPRRPARPTGARAPDRRPSGKPLPAGRAAPPAEARDDARIAKIMARAGLCSRRDAETWIAAGRVAVNGAIIDSPALNVRPGDRITVDGMPLPAREATRLFLFHKPRGVVTTARDPEARQTIFDVLPEGLPRLVTVGRLDINTEGLLLLTNDGGLARILELPATGWLRRYRVRANGEIAQTALDALKGGIEIEGVSYAGIEATLDRQQGANVWLTMGLREGKNREIKRILEHLGLAVTRLIRTSFGPFQLGDQPVGTVIEVRPRVLRDELGEALVREAGLDLREPSRPAARKGADEEPVPAGRPKPGARAHVSALRAAREEAGTEGRRRTERGATADRRGRTVAVERVSSTTARSEAPEGRNAWRFAGEKRGEGGARPARPRPAASRARDAEAPGGAPARGPAPRGAASRDAAPFGARPSGPGRPRARAYDAPREDRADGEFRRARDGDARPSRGFGGKPGGGKPEGGKPEGSKRFGGRPFGERSAGGKSPGGQSSGARSPGAKSSGDGSPGGKPFGTKSSGFKARPTGGLDGRPARRDAEGGGKPPANGRPAGNRPQGGKPYGNGRPQGGKPHGNGRPQGGGRQGGGGPRR